MCQVGGARCHRVESTTPVSSVTLRPWQRAAYELFRSSPDPDFLAVATPGAGKTTFALTCARAQLADWARHGSARRLVIVAPTSQYPK